MTLHVLVAAPPRPGLSLPGLTDGPLGADAAARLHAASLKDAMVAAADSGGELLINYPTDDQLPAEHRTGASPEADLRSLAEAALGDADDARFEVQVGSSFAARAGNAATHLLEEAGEASVAVLRGTAPTLRRTGLDGAAMKLRRHQAVLGPGTGGRVAYLGLSAPIDFEGAFEPPVRDGDGGGEGANGGEPGGGPQVEDGDEPVGGSEVEDLAERAVAADHEVAFLPVHPVIEDEAGLATLVAEVRARLAAGRNVPAHTADAVERLGLCVVETEGVRRVAIDSPG